MPLSMVERETIILFNEGEKTAEVFTNNDKLRKKLEQASARHPEIYRHKSTDQYGGVTYEFPKKWLDIRFREPISEKRHIQLSNHMKRLNENKTI